MTRNEQIRLLAEEVHEGRVYSYEEWQGLDYDTAEAPFFFEHPNGLHIVEWMNGVYVSSLFNPFENTEQAVGVLRTLVKKGYRWCLKHTGVISCEIFLPTEGRWESLAFCVADDEETAISEAACRVVLAQRKRE